jgi:hypothetical protein
MKTLMKEMAMTGTTPNKTTIKTRQEVVEATKNT